MKVEKNAVQSVRRVRLGAASCETSFEVRFDIDARFQYGSGLTKCFNAHKAAHPLAANMNIVGGLHKLYREGV